MRKLVLVLPFLFICLVFFMGQSTQDKTEKWTIDPRTTGVYDPSVVVSAPLPMVYDNFQPNPQTYYYNTPNGIFVVNPNTRVLPKSSTPPYTTQSEVIITRHPLNPLIMYGSSNAITSSNGSSLTFISEGAYVTTNGGTSWFGSDSMKNSVGAPLTGHGGDPGITIDKDGRFIISHLGGGIKANFSTNNGLNWSSDFTIVTGSQDKNLSGTDDSPSSPFYGRSYTVFSRFTASLPPIAISYTTNGGVNWSVATDINSNVAGHYSQGCDIRTGPNGEVYVCWTQPITSGSFTGDFVGFAKSTNGGVNWVINTNNAYDMNGIRGNLLSTNIRVNDFPRMDVDRTCGPRAGWIYIVTAERNLSPAGTDADIVLHRSTNGGTSWSAGVRVNQDGLNNGKSQWFPAVRVDESGAVNVVYYDNRNPTTTDSAEIYISRSLDGGFTFSDLKVSDHRFKPKPITLSGIASGYQGDYIGITSALVPGNSVNGNQRLWPLWMDDATGIYQAWTTKVELLPKNPCSGCEDFSSSSFTPSYFSLEYSGNQFWTRQNQSAYGSGSGSAMYNFYNDNVFSPQSLITDFQAVGAGYYLTFDEAYAPYGASNFGPDTLLVEASANGGTSYTTLAMLTGKFDGSGELNTAPPNFNSYVPASSEWRPKIYSLPSGTNRIRLKAKSGYGNNLYLDNICIQALPAPVANSIGIASQGMWLPGTPYWRLLDTVRVYLHRTDFPNVIVDSAKMPVNTINAVVDGLMHSRALSGTYYMVVKHRNMLETWSNVGVTYTRGFNTHHNFIPDGQSYGNNQAVVNISPLYRGMYSGDVNQDNSIDAPDLAFIDNDALAFVTGYVRTDLNGDNTTDALDIAIADNNAANFVSRQAPPGAEPQPVVSARENEAPVFNNESERQKYELYKQRQKESGNSDVKTETKTVLTKEFMEAWENRAKGRPEERFNRQKLNVNQNNSPANNTYAKLPGEL